MEYNCLFFYYYYLSNFLIINYLPNVYLRQNDGSTPIVLMLRGCCSDDIIDII